MRTASFQIGGMGCGACVKRVSEAIRTVPGVEAVEVAVGSATVRLPDDGSADPQSVVDVLARSGYRATERPRPETDAASCH